MAAVRGQYQYEVCEGKVCISPPISPQDPGSPDRPKDLLFPSMDQLGVSLITVLDHLRVPRVLGLGNGAGANIITRFGMMHPGRVTGIVAINNTATASLERFMERLMIRMGSIKKGDRSGLNVKNVSRFAESYKNRTEILSEMNKKIKFEMLLIAGMKSKYGGDTETIHKEMSPGLCSIIKLEDVIEPLTENPEKTAEALILFCQGLGHLATVSGGSRNSGQEVRG